MAGDRGQAHALEGIVAAILLVTSLVFALQVTAVTPLSASTSSQHIENQQQATAEGVLETAVDQGVLRPALLYGTDEAIRRDGSTSADDNRFAFHETLGDVWYTNTAPTNRFGTLLTAAFDRNGLAYNVYVYHQTDTGVTRTRMVYQGQPSDNAVAARQTVTLYDDDVLYEPGDTDRENFDPARPTTTTLVDAAATGDLYMDDASPTTPVFNVVEVEVVVWRQ